MHRQVFASLLVDGKHIKVQGITKSESTLNCRSKQHAQEFFPRTKSPSLVDMVRFMCTKATAADRNRRRIKKSWVVSVISTATVAAQKKKHHVQKLKTSSIEIGKINK